MPATKGMREWLPGGLQGGGASASSAQPGSQRLGVATSQVTVMGRVTNAMAPAKERAQNAQNMANAAGLPVGAAHDSAFEQCFPKLTFKQRIKGCLGCFVAGFFISFLSFMLYATGHTAGWAVVYTTGNFVSLMGSGYARARAHRARTRRIACCAQRPRARPTAEMS